MGIREASIEDAFSNLEAETADHFGSLEKARQFSRQAGASAMRTEKQERAGRHEAEAAVREAIFGNVTEARQHAAAALGLSTAKDVMYGAALAFARTGESARAKPWRMIWKNGFQRTPSRGSTTCQPFANYSITNRWN